MNRIDEIVYFESLSEEHILDITRLQLKQTQKRLKEQGITLSFSKDAIKHLADLGYSKEFGARPLKRAVRQHVVNPLAAMMLKEPGKKEFELTTEAGQLKIG